MSKNDGGSAFPVSAIDAAEPGSPDEMKRLAQGMSLRDYFAAKAMQGLQSVYWDTADKYDSAKDMLECMAQTSYEIADAMLKEREK